MQMKILLKWQLYTYIYIYKLRKVGVKIFIEQISTPMSCQVLNWNMEIYNGLKIEKKLPAKRP